MRGKVLFPGCVMGWLANISRPRVAAISATNKMPPSPRETRIPGRISFLLHQAGNHDLSEKMMFSFAVFTRLVHV